MTDIEQQFLANLVIYKIWKTKFPLTSKSRIIRYRVD